MDRRPFWKTRVCLVTSIRKKSGIGGSTVGEVSYFPASVEFESRDESRVENGDPPSLYFDKGDHKSKGAAITRATKFPRR